MTQPDVPKIDLNPEDVLTAFTGYTRRLLQEKATAAVETEVKHLQEMAHMEAYAASLKAELEASRRPDEFGDTSH